MNVSCPSCSTVFRVDPAKVPVAGVRARCSACGGVIAVGIAAPAEPHAQPPSAPVHAAAPPRPTPPAPFVPRTPPTAGFGQIQRAGQAAGPMIAGAGQSSQAATISSGARSQPTGRITPPMAPRVTPAQASPRPTPPQAASPSVPQAAPAAAGRRPVNPFLSRDPGMRAGRLARALVSDMVAYYPAKHAEGLDKGTLKELFRDEIKKSYEEYTAQVGADFARNTTHFQESLNEVLGAGKKIF